jgi:hypothetical protein
MTQLYDCFRDATCRSHSEPIPSVGQISGTTLTGQRNRAAGGMLFGGLIGCNGIVLQVIERLQLLDQLL